MSRYIEDILKALKSVKKNNKSKDYGICNLVYLKLKESNNKLTYKYFYAEDLRYHLSMLFIKWPKFSGYIDYPVPGGYDAFNSVSDLWAGDYGKLRMELLDFMIEELEKEIK